MQLALLALFLFADPPVAITGATVVVDGKTTIEKATVVMRDGLIEAVGAGVEVPFDAKVVDGSGLVVYAGFIDGHTGVGLPDLKRAPEAVKAAEGEQTEFQKKVLAHMAEANRKGVRPELTALDVIDAKDDQLKKWRAAGFTTALVAPGEELLGGRAALLNLSGKPRRTAVLRSPLGHAAGTRTYGPGYPETPMGAYTHIRQTLLDAQYYARQVAAWKPGQPRPASDEALAALGPVVEGKTPLYWEASSENEIRRAIAMAEEFKLEVIIAGGEDAARCLDMLKGRRVILSLKWPKEVKAPKDDDKYEEGKEPAPRKEREERRRRWEQKAKAAIALHEAKIDFCFSTRGLEDPKEALGNVRQLIEWGLPREAALAAFTTEPAALFGVGDLTGTVEKGRVANLTVLTKPLGDKDAKVRYVFVDGVMFDLEKEERKAEVEIAGAWEITVTAPTGKVSGTIDFKQDGTRLSGSIKSIYGSWEIGAGAISGKEVAFSFPFTMGKERFDIEFKGEVKEGEISGTVHAPVVAESTFTAKRPKGTK